MKEILKQLECILSRGYSSSTIFNDWLDLMIYALQRDDEHYLEIVKKYRNDQPQGKREIDHFCYAFGLLTKHMQKTNDEVLGEVYMEWNMANRYRGQFFTPKHIAGFMAKCLSPKGEKILDPCCGSGIMLVESIKTMTNCDLDNAVFYGQDIDLTCVKMCALNLLFFNVHGFVIWGDTLLMECNKVYQTNRSYLGGSIRELQGEEFETFKTCYQTALAKTVKEKEATIKEMTEAESEQLSKTTEQLMLF
jgi:type I restriction-modification system DNA methylase subunit